MGLVLCAESLKVGRAKRQSGSPRGLGHRVGQFWRQRPNRAWKINMSALFLIYYAPLVMAGW